MPPAESNSAADARLARSSALRQTDLLSTEGEAAFNRLARLARRLLSTPVAVVSLIEDERLLFKGSSGLPERWVARGEAPLADSVCGLVAEDVAPLVVPDAGADPRVRDLPAVSELGISAYLGVPLAVSGEYALGTFCVSDFQPRNWSPEDLELLQELAASVLTELRLIAAAERAEAQAAVSAHEREQFAHLVNDIDAIVWEADARTWQFTFVSQQAERILGYPAERWLQEEGFWASLIHPEDREQAVQTCSRATAAGMDHEFEYRVLCADGRVVWVRDVVRVILGTDGKAERLRGLLLDVTAQKQAEAALAARERWFRSLIEKSSDLISILEADGTVLYVSPSLERILGYRREEVVGRAPFELIHPDDREQMATRFGTVVADPEAPPVHLPFRLKCRDGSWRWFESTATNLLQDPVVRGVVVNSHDISERHRAEEALRSSEHRFRAIFDEAAIGIALIAASGELLDCNRALCALVGFPAPELVRVGVPGITHPEDLEADRRLFREIVAGARDSYQLDKRFVRPDGRQVWGRLTLSSVRDLEGTLQFAIGMVEDITERRRSQERTRAFHLLGPQLNLASTPSEAARIVVDAADQLLGWDCCWVELIDAEFREGTMVIGLDLIQGVRTEIPPSGYHPGVSPLALRAINEGAVLVLREQERLPKPTDPDRWFFGDVARPSASILCVPIRSGERAIGALSIQSYTCNAYNSEDVSTLQALADYCAGALERTRAEAAWRDLQEQLLQAQKMDAVGRLAGGVAHDFNNMLAVINGYSDLILSRKDTPETVRAPLGEIRHAGERAASLTRQLLAFSRKQLIQPQVLDLAEVVGHFQTLLHPLIGEDILLSTETREGSHIRADRVQIEQVLMNLAVNARDAMPQGGDLLIRVEPEEIERAVGSDAVPPGRYVLLTVSDTGCGMDAETMAHLYEPFFTTKPPGQGTGLGLATVYGIVEQNRGHIRVVSEPGAGSTFRLYFPSFAEIRADRASEATGRSGTGAETILVVEDEAILRGLICNVLRTSGYQVLEAATADVALQTCEAHTGNIDLLLTDVVMPGRSGRELAVFAQSRFPDLAVIYMSGYTDDAVVRHGVHAAEVPFLQKPFNPADLVQTVRSVLDAKVPS